MRFPAYEWYWHRFVSDTFTNVGMTYLKKERITVQWGKKNDENRTRN